MIIISGSYRRGKNGEMRWKRRVRKMIIISGIQRRGKNGERS